MKENQITTVLNSKRDKFLFYFKNFISTRLPGVKADLQGLMKKLTALIKTTGLVLFLYRFFLFYPFAIIYLEVVFKIAVFKTLFNAGLIYMVLYSIPSGLLLYILSTFSKRKINRIISIVLTAGVTLIYLIQIIYYHVFTTFFALFSLNGAGQVLQFWREILMAIGKNIIPIIFLLLPLFFLITFGNKLIPSDKTVWSFKGIIVGIMLSIQILSTFVVLCDDDGELSTRFLYSEAIIPDLSVDKFGLLTTTRLDVKHLLFGFDASGEKSTDDNNTDNNEEYIQEYAGEEIKEYIGEYPKGNLSDAKDGTNLPQSGKTGGGSIKPDINPADEKTVFESNILNIDFDKLIAGESDPQIKAMHKYFKNVKPTNKNEYTGMFKGKNLIFITAEGFSPYAVNKDLTPTLYKMSQEGFQFTDFYTPIWGVSTSDGEFVACNSLVPKSGVWSFYVSGKNHMPFCLGNQLKKLGYGTKAYHNHSYTYYHRDVSHPNMGYDFKAVGHGLNMKKTWPESDVEMIEKTTDEYIGAEPFHTYYMTVSGHLQYTFGGNAMAAKNKAFVKDLPYSEHVKAYLACQIEFDRAMGELISRLEKAGKAEDTLIAISPDHYPYGLTFNEIEELAGHKIEENFELYKGIFLLWSKGMTPVRVDKPCSSMDILPTLSNLLGVDYDSRLLMGGDIFSDATPLVIFSNWSWLTDKARYNSKQRKLIPVDGQTDTSFLQEYKSEISKQVSNKFSYSTKILDKNYYSKLFIQRRTNEDRHINGILSNNY